jgi:hypothetical protein
MSKISKLGLGIVAFEGTEHIKNITYEIRDLCDEIVVCLQKNSYHGEPIDPNEVKIVENLKNLGFIDDIIWFEPTDFHTDRKPGDAPRIIETDKRNFICEYLENEAKCSHSIIIDSDEFYDHDDFALAKQIFDGDEKMHVSYCQYVNYYRDYRHVMVWPFDSYVPFIAEAENRFDFDKGNFGKPSDPTRRYLLDLSSEKSYFNIFNWDVIKMHHLSWIRIHIESKINSWSSKKLFDNIEELHKQILNRYYHYEDGLNAILMFRTPCNQVQVNILPKQYIHPHFRLDEEPTEHISKLKNLSSMLTQNLD